MDVNSTRTWWRWMQRPWVTLVLLIVLGADFARLYNANRGVGRLARDAMWAIKHPGAVRDRFGSEYYFAREGAGLVPLFRDGESADRFSRMVTGEPQNVLQVLLAPPDAIGPWVPAYEHRPVAASWMDGTPADEPTRRAAVAAISAEMDAEGGHAAAAELRDDPFGTRRVLWPGVAHNLVVLVIGASLFVSLGWMLRWVRSLRRQPWQCRGCGYDLRGSDAPMCPECGRGR